MKKKVIGVIVLLLVFLFPFRLAFLEYPANINVNNTLILYFMFSTMTEGDAHSKH
jgi:hypothetical protein